VGMFDYANIYDGYTEAGELVPNTHFKCPAGHDLKGEEFQTKDFGCTLGEVQIYPDEVLFNPSIWSAAEAETVGTGTFNVYTGCLVCRPAKPGLMHGLWCEFEMVLESWKIISVKATESSW
jgi:hypothetical protein